jgi:threonine synthase
LECTACSTKYLQSEKSIMCPKCRQPLDVKYDLNTTESKPFMRTSPAQPRSMWRYRDFLPIQNTECIVTLCEGSTPFVRSSRLAAEIGLSDLVLKLEYLNPTGSFKDRGTTVSISRVFELGIKAVLDDSSGNAGASLAAYSAAAGIQCTLYVPAAAASEKLVQAEMYGAKIVKVDGSRTEVAKAAELAWKSSGLYYASHNLSPFFFEGMKTFAYEIVEDLNGQVPDHVVFPVGGGALIAGAYKGFEDSVKLGWTDRVPKLHCVQSEACMPIVEAFRKETAHVEPVVERETVAGGIRISNPARGDQVLRAVRDTGATAVSVADDEILQAQSLLARKDGIFAEPTSCAAIAGVIKLLKMKTIQKDDSVVVPLTGSGLKDIGTASKGLQAKR